MRTLLLKSLFAAPVTIAPPLQSLRYGRPEGAWQRSRKTRAASVWPFAHDPGSRCGVVQWLRTGDSCTQQFGLPTKRAFRPEIRRVAAPCRRAARHGAGELLNMKVALERDLCSDARSQMGGCRRRLRLRLRRVRGKLCGGRRCGQGDPGRSATSAGLSAAPHRSPARPDRAGRRGDREGQRMER